MSESGNDPVRVILADDHAVVREGLRSLLERGDVVRVVGEAATGREAIDLTMQLRPDVVVMDFAMPELNGVEACQQIHVQMPSVKVLFLSMYEDEGYLVRALEAGAAGYLVKRSAASEIQTAVLGAARGEVYLAPTLATVLVRTLTQPATYPSHAGERHTDAHPLDALTAREREVLQCVAEGQTSAEIARALGIGIKTVQSHREHIMEKLELRDIPHLVRFALYYGLIAPEP